LQRRIDAAGFPTHTRRQLASELGVSIKTLGDLDDIRTNLQKAQRAAALIYAHFKKEFGMPDKK
jgi:hypothetical protein